MKSCAVCGCVAPLDQKTCTICGEASWSAVLNVKVESDRASQETACQPDAPIEPDAMAGEPVREPIEPDQTTSRRRTPRSRPTTP